MAARKIALLICLWASMLTLTVSVGGNLFQAVVIDPVWSASPPESLETVGKTSSESSIMHGVTLFHQNPISRFGLICLALSPIVGWNDRSIRKWLLAGAIIFAVVFIATVVYFHPLNDMLFENAAGKPAAVLRDAAQRWLWADRVRFALRVMSFFCVLKALMIFSARREEASAA
jgi:uncharacterized membrane protein